ncbi:hypothetical protein [Microvirga sp. VF16]|uniref:hypothetical protein n=1 Tax=Microvirga sp. VF16 TaxID=2807101 RepID=UPI00193E1BCA|nr:hypothetical protein [Microvirga sp. VF16]QRM32438.1 hypothetical protein JO965_30535 [Microvirga sp. VF16]
MEYSVEAIPVSSIAGISPTADGAYIVVKLVVDGGQELALALPYDTGIDLLQASSAALGEALRRKSTDPTSILVTPLEWWSFQPIHDNRVLLSLRQPGGLEVNHILHKDAITHMREVLDSVLEDVAIGTPRQLKN